MSPEAFSADPTRAAFGLSATGAARLFGCPRGLVCQPVFRQVVLSGRDCGGNLGPNSSYAARPKSLRYCMGLL